MSKLPKLLLILDIDETLLFATKDKLGREEDFIVGSYFVCRRPYLKEFLEGLASHFDLAVWSSASDDYVMDVLKHIIPEDMKLIFTWGRSKWSIKIILSVIFDKILPTTSLKF